jgi:ATP-dependent RNA helicase DBP3
VVAEKKRKKSAQSPWWAENHVNCSGVDAPVPALAFRDCGFPKRLAKACEGKFDAPTLIQAAAWPLLMEGKDLVAIAKTGSGKTLGFTLPFLALSELGTLETIQQPSCQPRMVCLAPTRELVQQIATVVEEFAALASKVAGKYPVTTIVGGLPKWQQKQMIKDTGADIVCATTGRLLDLVENDGALDMSKVQFLVLDEADRMLDMGFVDDVKKLASRCPATRQTVFFSATWPRAVHRLATSLTRDSSTATVTVGAKKIALADAVSGDEEDGPGDVETEGPPVANDKIQQIVEIVYDGRKKQNRLIELLHEHKKKKIIVFGLYKKECATLERNLQQRGFPECVALQGDMQQTARNTVMENFRSGKARLLIATDVASRGLDVKDIELVINYTFPLTIEDFVHRVGRTARGARSGMAITLFNAGPADGVQDEKCHAGDLVRVLRQAKQPVPAELDKIAGTSQGNKATKKKAHPLYGNFFKDEAEMAKLEAKKVHKTFDDSDDE